MKIRSVQVIMNWNRRWIVLISFWRNKVKQPYWHVSLPMSPLQAHKLHHLSFKSSVVRLGIVYCMFDTTDERRYQTETKADPLDAEHREESKIEEHRQRSSSEGRGNLIEDRRENGRAEHDLGEPEDLMTIMLFDGREHHPYEYVKKKRRQEWQRRKMKWRNWRTIRPRNHRLDD